MPIVDILLMRIGNGNDYRETFINFVSNLDNIYVNISFYGVLEYIYMPKEAFKENLTFILRKRTFAVFRTSVILFVAYLAGLLIIKNHERKIKTKMVHTNCDNLSTN